MNTNLESLVKYNDVLEKTVKGKDDKFSVDYFAFYGVLEQLVNVSKMLTFLLDSGHYDEKDIPKTEFILKEVNDLHKQYSNG